MDLGTSTFYDWLALPGGVRDLPGILWVRAPMVISL